MADKVYVGRKCQSFQSFGEYEPFTGVKLWRDDDTYFFSGDDTGRVMEVTHRSATQGMADNILDGIKGFVYKPFEAKGCELDPAAELGDAVTICGMYTMIGSMRKDFKNGGLVDIGLPGGKEINHEYPYKSPQERELKRRVKLGQKYQGVQIDRLNGLTITEMAEDGTAGAKAVFNSKELTFYDMGGGKVLYFDPVSKTYKFMGELNVNDKFVVDKGGNVTLAGNIYMGDGNLVWGKNAPTKKQFSVSASGPWHSEMKADDKWRQDWDYSASPEGWGPAYQFKGVDGKPGADGSDADVPSYIKKTEIDATGIKTFHIKANKVEAVCPKGTQSDSETGFILTGAFEDAGLRYLRIHSYADPAPYVRFSSPNGCFADWSFDRTDFSGVVDFSGATVTGATFVLA